jgi:hypothetical protein
MSRQKASATSFAWRTGKSGQASAVVRRPLSEDWEVTVAFANRDGKASVESIHIRSTSDLPREALTTRLVRRIRLGELLVQAQAEVPSQGEEHFRFLGQTRRRGFHRLLSDLELAKLAVAYEAACATNAKPRIVLAKAREESPGKVRDLIHEARRRELLSPAVPGKAGGTATATAKRLLAEPQESANRAGEERRDGKKKR